jgi:hypothetical protein
LTPPTSLEMRQSPYEIRSRRIWKSAVLPGLTAEYTSTEDLLPAPLVLTFDDNLAVVEDRQRNPLGQLERTFSALTIAPEARS